MIEHVRKRIRERVCQHFRSRYEMLKVEPALGLFNHKCFMNVVEYARRYPEMEVIEVVFIEDGHPRLHYVNRDPTDGKYLETTLGWQAHHLEYYFLRRIHPSDYHRIHGEFQRALDDWTLQFTNWFQRNVLGIERVL